MRPPSAAQSRAVAVAPAPRGFPGVACPENIARDIGCLLLTHTSIIAADDLLEGTGLDVPVMLHQREDRRSVRLIRDRTAALPVVPAHVELVHEHAIGDVLRRHDAFVRVTRQKELPAM